MLQSVPLRTRLRILCAEKRQVESGFVSACSVKVQCRNRTQRRHTKNSVSSRNAGLSYLWIRWDS